LNTESEQAGTSHPTEAAGRLLLKDQADIGGSVRGDHLGTLPVHVVHPALRRVFAALDEAGITWCLLRGEAALADPTGDIDLLVATEDLDRLDEVLPAEGFLHVPARGAHHSFVGYDAATSRFLELDVESDVDFGPSGHPAVNWLRPTLRTGAAQALLANRCRQGPLTLPDPDDAFWALLLHCIVDKGAVAERHRARLVELAVQARPDGFLGRVVSAHCPPGWSAEQLLAAAGAGRWAELVALGAQLPGRATTAGRAAAFGRGLRRLATATRSRRRGLSVAVMGPDGAGKSTLTRAVATSFGLPVRVVYMGLWQGEGDGATPSLPAAALAAARRPFRSWKRAATAAYHQARGRLVVFDRHPYDALLPPAPPYVGLKRAFFTLLARTVPAPSLVLVLDLPAEVTARRRPDENPAALAAARADYLALAQKLPQAVVLDADRTPDALRAEAVDRIWQAVWAAGARRS
jgi:thymidylate kinase